MTWRKAKELDLPAGVAVMEALQEERLQDNAATVGAYFKDQLQIMEQVMPKLFVQLIRSCSSRSLSCSMLWKMHGSQDLVEPFLLTCCSSSEEHFIDCEGSLGFESFDNLQKIPQLVRP